MAVDDPLTSKSVPQREGVPGIVQSSSGPSRVRRAGRDDIAVIDVMLRSLALESPVIGTFAIADGKLANYLAKVVRSNDHVVLLHEGSSGVDGFYIGMLVQQFFTFEYTAMDIAFYVRPTSRGSLAAKRLFQDFERWAKSRGATAIQVGSMTGIDAGRTAKFYRGMGLREVGGIYHVSLGSTSLLTKDR